MPDKNKPTGLTKDVGFQVGARQTFPVSTEKAWDFLVSPEGTRLWLDDLDISTIEMKTAFTTTHGYIGKITVFKPNSHLRMKWQHPDWNNTSTLQIRTIPNKDKTTISFHQEKLSGPEQREEMKIHWLEVLAELKKEF